MSYTAPVYLLQPGQRETIPVVGREVVVIEADKDFLIATNSGEPQFITAGLQLAPDGGFENIVMRNPHAEAISVRLGITDGAIKDNRASVSTVLPVRDPDDLSSFSGVIAQLASDNAAILAMMQNATDKRADLTDLSGMSFASVTASSSTVVTSGANVNGIHIAFAAVHARGSVTATVTVDGNEFLFASGYSGGANSESIRDIIIPAGVALAITSNHADARARVFYKVL